MSPCLKNARFIESLVAYAFGYEQRHRQEMIEEFVSGGTIKKAARAKRES